MSQSGGGTGGSGNTVYFGDGSGTSVLNGTLNYLSGGGSAATLVSSALLGSVVSLFLAPITILNAAVSFVATPLTSGGKAIGAVINALFTAPAQLLQAGARISANSIQRFLGGSVLGIFGFTVAVGVVLLAFWMYARYREEKETGNLLPGDPIDIPWIGSDEEATVDE